PRGGDTDFRLDLAAKTRRPTKTPSATRTETAVPTKTPTPPETNTPEATVTATPQATKTKRPTKTPTLAAPSQESATAVTTGLGIQRYWAYQKFDLPGTGLSLSLDHTYNNQASLSNNIVGYDWIHTQRMYILDNGDNTATLFDADGTQLLFTNGATGTYTSPKGNFDTLTRVTGVSFTLTHPDQSQHIFQQNANSNWYLTQIHDPAGNTITFTYPSGSSNKVSTITAGGGRSLNFSYNGAKLASVTDNAAHTFNYSYDANTGDLLSVQDPMNFTTAFAYTNHN